MIWVLRKIKRKLLQREKPLTPSFPKFCPYVNVKNEIGDLILWDLRSIHSPWFVTLNHYPNLVLPPYFEKYVPRIMEQQRSDKRSTISATYGIPSNELDSYMKWIGSREDYARHWKPCNFHKLEVQKLLNDNGLEVKTDCLKHAKVI